MTLFGISSRCHKDKNHFFLLFINRTGSVFGFPVLPAPAVLAILWKKSLLEVLHVVCPPVVFGELNLNPVGSCVGISSFHEVVGSPHLYSLL